MRSMYSYAVLKREPRSDKVTFMQRGGTISNQEAHYKAQARHYLAEAQRILRELAAGRRRERPRTAQASIVKEVKAILRGA